MLRGDLDNVLAPGIGIRFEGLVRLADGSLNRNIKASMLAWMRDLEANLYIITCESERTAAAFCLKRGVPYTRIIQVDSVLEIPDIARDMDLLTYYDVDKTVLVNINARGHGNIKAEEWTTPED